MHFKHFLCSFCKCIFIRDKKLVCLHSPATFPSGRSWNRRRDVIAVNGTNCYNIKLSRHRQTISWINTIFSAYKSKKLYKHNMMYSNPKINHYAIIKSSRISRKKPIRTYKNCCQREYGRLASPFRLSALRN